MYEDEESGERPPTRREGSCSTGPEDTPLAVAIPSTWRGGEVRGAVATGEGHPVWMDEVRAALAERERERRACAAGPQRWDRSARSSTPAAPRACRCATATRRAGRVRAAQAIGEGRGGEGKEQGDAAWVRAGVVGTPGSRQGP